MSKIKILKVWSFWVEGIKYHDQYLSEFMVEDQIETVFACPNHCTSEYSSFSGFNNEVITYKYKMHFLNFFSLLNKPIPYNFLKFSKFINSYNPDIIHIYARAGSDAGAYWPPVNTPVPGLGITNWNYSLIYPVGQIFGDLSKSYKGKSLQTTSNGYHLAAALNDSETMVLYITGGKEQGKKVAVKIDGFTIRKIESVERFVPDDYADTAKAAAYKIEPATAEISSDNEVFFDINKEGTHQIYKIVLKSN